MKYKDILLFARSLRKNQTPAEAFFWKKVRNRKLLGKKFNRQFIIEHARFNDNSQYFIADFYCHKHRLIVELDGGIHNEQQEYDQIREEILREMNYSIIRFKNEEVLDNWKQVEEKLRDFFTKKSQE